MSSLRSLLLGAALALVSCDGRARFTESEVNAWTPGEGFPRGFLLGAATAAYQIEGGQDNDWTRWELGSYPDGRPHIVNNQRSGRAAGSWADPSRDVANLRALGANAYRLSIEWSRLEPQEGQWDAAVVDHYRAHLRELRASGLRPFVTLWHFTLPRWFADRGGWTHPDAVATFRRYVARAAQSFGDLVDDYCTINEPNVYALEAYSLGEYPPGQASMGSATQVLGTLLRAHAAAASALRESDTRDADGDGRATYIGLAHHVRVFQPASSSELDTVVAALTDDYFNEAVPRAASTGRVVLFVPGDTSIDEAVPGLQGSFDFLGLNYYTRDTVRADLGDPALSHMYTPAARPRTDLGWDIYPEGMYQLLVRFGRYGWPIYVTENGIADRNDTQRAWYLRSHLYAMRRAMADGVDIRGYFHWSLMDNFEWSEGTTGRFGLYSVNFDDPSQPRVLRPSGALFQQTARTLGLMPR